MVSALKAPFRLIIENAGGAELPNVEQEVRFALEEGVGFNAETNRVENLFAAGVKDSARSLKSAIELAYIRHWFRFVCNETLWVLLVLLRGFRMSSNALECRRGRTKARPHFTLDDLCVDEQRTAPQNQDREQSDGCRGRPAGVVPF